ncbi:MAG: hypothetical protein KGI47_05785 [Betaproteobacteria bacterium]|nr:hypothetical protein [Betaproteobacteria bacterium]MDE2622944.1 hypothetical protein [Betaproteobacteria bacterium]
MRLLLWGLVIWLAIKYILPALGRISAPTAPPPPPPPDPDAGAQEMVRCAHCGLYIPRTEALPGGGAFYCSEPHRRAGLR